MMVIENAFNLSDIVYLKTDAEQLQRIVYAIRVLPNGLIYHLTQGTSTSEHYDFEISTEKSVLIDL